MGEKEPDWLKIPRSLIRLANTYLEKCGYADYDVYELAKATPTKNPASPYRNALADFNDNRPYAEIVATAHMKCIASYVLLAWEQGDQETATKLMFDLGYQKAISETFVICSGLSADAALGANSYLWAAFQAKDLSTKSIKSRAQLERARVANLKKSQLATAKRDELICSKAQGFINLGKKSHEVTSLIEKNFVRENLWEKYPPFEPLTTKRIREILRKGKVIPPARKRNIS